MKDAFKENEATGKVENTEGPGGEPFGKRREKMLPRGVAKSIINQRDT